MNQVAILCCHHGNTPGQFNSVNAPGRRNAPWVTGPPWSVDTLATPHQNGPIDSPATSPGNTHMTSRKHTHTGHCQACTHIQAVSVTTGGIAKHGYTTRFGFFAGTCKGSDKLSLQVSREYADAILVELAAYAAEHDAHVAALQAGTKTPLVIVTQDYDRDEQGRIKTDHQGNRLRVRIPFA